MQYYLTLSFDDKLILHQNYPHIVTLSNTKRPRQFPAAVKESTIACRSTPQGHGERDYFDVATLVSAWTPLTPQAEARQFEVSGQPVTALTFFSARVALASSTAVL